MSLRVCISQLDESCVRSAGHLNIPSRNKSQQKFESSEQTDVRQLEPFRRQPHVRFFIEALAGKLNAAGYTFEAGQLVLYAGIVWRT